ncbi:MAG: hypothetical protein RQM92_11000 [Candidatus Syntrophopropionicum ammoniitolerans]
MAVRILETRTGEWGHTSVWGLALQSEECPRIMGPGLIVVGRWWLVIGGQAARGISPSIVKISRFDKNRRHRALIQRASEPEGK